MMMFDSARMELGLNALISLESAGVLPRVIVFALDVPVYNALISLKKVSEPCRHRTRPRTPTPFRE